MCCFTVVCPELHLPKLGQFFKPNRIWEHSYFCQLIIYSSQILAIHKIAAVLCTNLFIHWRKWWWGRGRENPMSWHWCLPYRVIWVCESTLWVRLFNQFKNYLHSYQEPWYISNLIPTYFKKMIFTYYIFLLLLRIELFSYLINVFCGFPKKAMGLDSLFLIIFQLTQLSFLNQKSLCVDNNNWFPFENLLLGCVFHHSFDLFKDCNVIVTSACISNT